MLLKPGDFVKLKTTSLNNTLTRIRVIIKMLDILEASPVPVHDRDVASQITDDDWDPKGPDVQAQLAASPGVMLLSMGCYGTRRHFPEIDAITPDIVHASLDIMTSGSYDLDRDWAMHKLAPMVEELANPPCGLDAFLRCCYAHILIYISH